MNAFRSFIDILSQVVGSLGVVLFFLGVALRNLSKNEVEKESSYRAVITSIGLMTACITLQVLLTKL